MLDITKEIMPNNFKKIMYYKFKHFEFLGVILSQIENFEIRLTETFISAQNSLLELCRTSSISSNKSSSSSNSDCSSMSLDLQMSYNFTRDQVQRLYRLSWNCLGYPDTFQHDDSPNSNSNKRLSTDTQKSFPNNFDGTSSKESLNDTQGKRLYSSTILYHEMALAAWDEMRSLVCTIL